MSLFALAVFAPVLLLWLPIDRWCRSRRSVLTLLGALLTLQWATIALFTWLSASDAQGALVWLAGLPLLIGLIMLAVRCGWLASRRHRAHWALWLSLAVAGLNVAYFALPLVAEAMGFGQAGNGRHSAGPAAHDPGQRRAAPAAH